MRALIATLCLASLFGVSCVSSVKKPAYRTIPEQRTAAIEIVVTCPVDASGDQEKHWGSGVAVGPFSAITAAHVASCAGAVVTATQPDGPELTLRIESFDTKTDIARLLVIGGGSFKVSGTIGFARVFLGQQVCIAPGMPTRDYRCGDVEEFRDTPSGDIASNMAVEPGNSGSGVYNRRGQLVGILTHQRRTYQGFPTGSLFTSLDGKEWIIK